MSGKRRAAGPAVTKRPEPSGGRPRLRRFLKWGGISSLVLIVLAVASFAVLYKAIEVPDPNADFQTETTFVYYADGKTELGRFATQNRDSITFDEMPDSAKDAVVAAEDRSFWTNRGIDPKGIIRAAFSNAKGGSTQGASTITQQYVKILYLTQERSYKRKAKEAVVSLKLHRQQSKERILEGYLNTIYFGRGAYGIQAAADAYFNKTAAELTVPESAVLASVINNPTRFDPGNGAESAEALLGRYRYVLDGMVDMGELDAAEADRFSRALPKFPEIKGESAYAGQRGHMLEMVKRELARTGEFTEQEINGGGLKVYTTFTKKAMRAAERGVKEARPEGKKGLHVAVASVQPGTGALRGFYAGQDYLDSQINWAVTGGMPGSTFKPFALAAGIDSGYSLKDTFEGNSPYVFPNGDEVNNLGEDGGTDYGSAVSLLKATQDSINTAYIDLTASIPDGPEKVLSMANKLGIPKWNKRVNSRDHLRNSPGLQPNSGIALGSATVSPINMANAYATIANGGKAAPVFTISKVVDRDGEVRFQHRVSAKRVLEEDIAADVSYALQQVVEDGSGTKAQALGRPAAGKTGTATNADDKVSSSWYVGYTPQMSTAVMYVRGKGNESLEGFLDPFFGGTFPALTWTAVMDRLLEGTEVEDFPPPAFVDGKAPDEGHAPYTPPPKPEPKPEPKETKTAEPEPTPTPTPSVPPPPPPPSQDPPGLCVIKPDDPKCQTAEPEPEPSPTDTSSPDGTSGGMAYYREDYVIS